MTKNEAVPRPIPRRLPWELHQTLTADRLMVCARLLVRGRADAFRLADPWVGNDGWSIGCRAYSFSRNQLRQAATIGHYNWLDVLDETTIDEAFAVDPVWLGGLELHEVAEQDRGDVGHAHRGAGVAAFGLLDSIHGQESDAVCQVAQMLIAGRRNGFQ